MKKSLVITFLFFCFLSNVTFSSINSVDRLLRLLQNIAVPKEIQEVQKLTKTYFSVHQGFFVSFYLRPNNNALDGNSLIQIQENSEKIEINEGEIKKTEASIRQSTLEKDKIEASLKVETKKPKKEQENVDGKKSSIVAYEENIKILRAASTKFTNENIQLQQKNKYLELNVKKYCHDVIPLVNQLSEFSADQVIEALEMSITVEEWLKAIENAKDGKGNKFFKSGTLVAENVSKSIDKVKLNKAEKERVVQEAVLAVKKAEIERIEKIKKYPGKKAELVEEIDRVIKNFSNPTALNKTLASVKKDFNNAEEIKNVIGVFSGYENAGRFSWSNQGRFVFKSEAVNNYKAKKNALELILSLMSFLRFEREDNDNIYLMPLFKDKMSAKKLFGYLERSVMNLLEMKASQFYVDNYEALQKDKKIDFDIDLATLSENVLILITEDQKLSNLWKNSLVKLVDI